MTDSGNIPQLIDECLAVPVWNGRSMREWLEGGLPKMLKHHLDIFESEGNHYVRLLAERTNDPLLAGVKTIQDLCALSPEAYQCLSDKYDTIKGNDHAGKPMERGWWPIMGYIDVRQRGYKFARSDIRLFGEHLMPVLDGLREGRDPTMRDYQIIARASERHYGAFKSRECLPEYLPDAALYDGGVEVGIFMPFKEFMGRLRTKVREAILNREPGEHARQELIKQMDADEKGLSEIEEGVEGFAADAKQYSGALRRIGNIKNRESQ